MLGEVSTYDLSEGKKKYHKEKEVREKEYFKYSRNHAQENGEREKETERKSRSPLTACKY